MLTLDIEKRIVTGKRKGLVSDFMPAVYYGFKETSTPITVSKSAFKKVLKEAGESSVIVLSGEGKKIEALIHQVDFDPIKGEPRHADFYVIEAGKKVEVSVPIHFEGVSPAVKNLGGILVKVLHEMKIEAFPKNLPHSIIVNIEGLVDFDSKIHVKDITLPTGVSSLEESEEVVAAVSAPKEEKDEETAPVDLSAIEVEKKGKKEEVGESSEE